MKFGDFGFNLLFYFLIILRPGQNSFYDQLIPFSSLFQSAEEPAEVEENEYAD